MGNKPPRDNKGGRQRAKEVEHRRERQPDVLARSLVVTAVDTHAADCAKAIGLRAKGKKSVQFKDNLAEALHACLRAQRGPPRQRLKDLTDKLKCVEDLANATAPKLLELQALLNELRVLFGHYPSFRLPPLDPIAFDLSDQARAVLDQRLKPRKAKRKPRNELPPDAPSLAAMARHLAKTLKDKGGPRKKYPAFDTLLKGDGLLGNGLVHVYEQATGHEAAVTRNSIDDSYKGSFLDLVGKVLPLACKIAETVTGQTLSHPNSPREIGAHVNEVTRRDAGLRKQRRARSQS
jgi:hypothetical protein